MTGFGDHDFYSVLWPEEEKKIDWIWKLPWIGKYISQGESFYNLNICYGCPNSKSFPPPKKNKQQRMTNMYGVGERGVDLVSITPALGL